MLSERNTKQKQLIYSALVTLGHPSATEVYDYVRAENPKLSRGTVFRVLGGFSESGKAKRLRFQDSDDRFDATLVPHAHARCRLCGKIEDVFFDEGLSPCFPKNGFQIETCEIQFTGICSDCRRGEA